MIFNEEKEESFNECVDILQLEPVESIWNAQEGDENKEKNKVFKFSDLRLNELGMMEMSHPW